jgi:hypothetical protein
MVCSLLNISSCLPQKLYDFFIDILNAPILPLLNFVKASLTEPVNLGMFTSIWAIMLYIISMFYGILFMYAGFNFMISGHDMIKRSKAKEWFKNILIMIVLIQASYFLYSLVIDISAVLTAGVINLADESFFLITADNVVNIGLQLLFGIFYVLTLFNTAILLTFRYIIVAIGVVFIPFGIFFYFIPALQSYGKLILNFLGICIFVTFFDALIFLACSMLVDLPLFASMKILVMISAFSIANFLMFYLMFFSALKSAFKTGGKAVAIGAKVAAMVG